MKNMPEEFARFYRSESGDNAKLVESLLNQPPIAGLGHIGTYEDGSVRVYSDPLSGAVIEVDGSEKRADKPIRLVGSESLISKGKEKLERILGGNLVSVA